MYSKLTLATLFFINFGVAFAENTNGGVNQSFKEYFIKGGPAYMAPILLCLIIGLAVAIERIIYLTMATTNTKKLLTNVEDALKNGGTEAAKNHSTQFNLMPKIGDMPIDRIQYSTLAGLLATLDCSERL